MAKDLSRRELMHSIAVGGLVAAGSMTPISSLFAFQDPKAIRGPQPPSPAASRMPATIVDGKVIQPRRELAILRKTGVLVVGGGPAGTAAALSARRIGVDVTLVERYGYLGGLATGGLVLAIFPLFDRNKKPVILGIGEEMMKRLDKLKFGIIERNSDKAPYPTIDAEAFKYVLADMALASGINAYLDCWGVDAIIDAKGAVRGAVFESKSGRQAIVADIVVDASGDGDIYAAAGAAFQKVKDNIGLISRIGNIDIEDMAGANNEHTAGRRAKPQGGRPTWGMPVASLEGHVGSPTPAPHTNWLNMKGPVADGLDVAELSILELKHRRATWNNLERARRRPGADNAFLLETAPQMGVRLTRLLAGVKKLISQQVNAGTIFKDVIGYSGSPYAGSPEFQIPYGCLVPSKLDNLLAAGRCISTDFEVGQTTRLIPVCWVTGQAAGIAAALSVKDRCKPRELNINKLQKELKQQGAYLG